MPHFRSHLFAALAVAGVPFAPALHAAPQPGSILAADDGITVDGAWARASAGAATTAAAYVTLTGGAHPDSLVGVSTPVAATADVHETINDNGVMKMRPAPAIPLAPGQSVTFRPNGYHIMLMGLKQPLVAGQSFPLTLTFAHAAPLTVSVEVHGRNPAAAGSVGAHDHMHMQ